jgi:hypothetical protein
MVALRPSLWSRYAPPYGRATPLPMVALRPSLWSRYAPNPPSVIQCDMYHLWASVMPRMIADVGTRSQSLDAQYG